MMRAVALAKDEKGLPGLGAELTGSYRHLVETSAVWRKLADSPNPLLKDYLAVLDGMIGHRTWGESQLGQAWLRHVLSAWHDKQDWLQNPITEPSWLEAREPLSRSERAGRVRKNLDPEARSGSDDPLAVEELDEETTSSTGMR
jgi:hypothetical protein